MDSNNLKKQKHLLTYLWELYVHIVFFFMKIYKMQFVPIVKIEIKEPILSEMDVYIKLQKDRFLKSFENIDNKNSLNANIMSSFYSKMEFQQIMQETNNEIEPVWKCRILFETTPRGNVVMYYDPYKLGFTYYSDVNSIPYSLLNAVAMKYTLVYHCRDLFVDNQITPNDSQSPLIDIHFTNKDKPNTNGVEKKTKRVDFKDAPFAKFKNNKTIADVNSHINEVEKKDYNHNKFIFLGKISNFKFIQPSFKNINQINGFSSKLLDDLSGETQLQKQVMNYKDFKLESLRNKSNQ